MEWFIQKANKLYDDGHLSMNNDLLHLIALDKNKDYSIRYYKHSQQKTHLGAYCCYFISAFSYLDTEDEKWKDTAKEYLEDLYDTLKRSYKSEAKQLTDETGLGYSEYLNAVKQNAERLATDHIENLKNATGIDV